MEENLLLVIVLMLVIVIDSLGDASSLELVEFIDVGRSKMTVDRDDQGESDRGLRGGDGDGKDRDHDAGG